MFYFNALMILTSKLSLSSLVIDPFELHKNYQVDYYNQWRAQE